MRKLPTYIYDDFPNEDVLFELYNKRRPEWQGKKTILEARLGGNKPRSNVDDKDATSFFGHGLQTNTGTPLETDTGIPIENEIENQMAIELQAFAKKQKERTVGKGINTAENDNDKDKGKPDYTLPPKDNDFIE